MDLNQKSAINGHLKDLSNIFVSSLNPFIAQLQLNSVISLSESQVVEKQTTNEEKLVILFEMLKAKDNGWSATMDYLNRNNHINIATKLLKSAGDSVKTPNSSSISLAPLLREFSFELANYYQSQYCNVQMIYDSHRHIRHMWIPMILAEEEMQEFSTLSYSVEEFLRKLISSKSCNVALVKGNPGMGKTILLKKITYDWSVCYLTNSPHLFSLILAVPLRSVGKFENFLDSAVEFFVKTLNLGHINKLDLITLLCQLRSKLLLCFDGLDEYQSLAESPFKDLFAAPFTKPILNVKSEPPYVPYKLLITSRPYGCHRINPGFFLTRYQIAIMENSAVIEYVHKNCINDSSKAAIIQYLTNADIVIYSPWMLATMCHISNANINMSTKLSLFYELLLKEMIQREKLEGKLAEKICLENWKDSSIIRKISELAYKKTKERKTQPMAEEALISHVTTDSFICGFLLHKYDFNRMCLTTEFPNACLQHYFTALHCFHLFLDGSKAARNAVLEETCLVDNLTGRFFFGICSNAQNFSEMIDWLSPSIQDIQLQPAATVDRLFLAISNSLKDCSECESFQLGRKIFNSASFDVFKYGRQILSGLRPRALQISDCKIDLNPQFRQGLNLTSITETYWTIEAIEEEACKFAVVSGDQTKPFPLHFYYIETLVLLWESENFWTNSLQVIHHLGELPFVKTLVIGTDGTPGYKVDFQINNNKGSSLQTFVFRYSLAYRSKLMNLLSSRRGSTSYCSVRMFYQSVQLVSVIAQVKRSISQSDLIYDLIQTALDLFENGVLLRRQKSKLASWVTSKFT